MSHHPLPCATDQDKAASTANCGTNCGIKEFTAARLLRLPIRLHTSVSDLSNSETSPPVFGRHWYLSEKVFGPYRHALLDTDQEALTQARSERAGQQVLGGSGDWAADGW